MKKNISIPTTFAELRKLPLEVNFEKVEQWVQQQPAIELKKSSWMPNFLSQFWSSN